MRDCFVFLEQQQHILKAKSVIFHLLGDFLARSQSSNTCPREDCLLLPFENIFKSKLSNLGVYLHNFSFIRFPPRVFWTHEGGTQAKSLSETRRKHLGGGETACYCSVSTLDAAIIVFI